MGNSGYSLFRPDENGELLMFYTSPIKQHILDFPFEAGAVDLSHATEMVHEDI
jgi:hypothetical protein